MTAPIVHLIAAARPNFMKVAPLYHALRDVDWCRVQIVHSGQHYDANMSDAFLEDLGLPPPDFHLGVGSGTHAEQTARVMLAYEQVCLQQAPAWIVVVGDVNTTLACTLVGAKLGIPVAHLEAGLRSRDRRMPEEINRLVTDTLADVLWTPSTDADENLAAEGIPGDKIEFVGNIMIDSYELLKERIESSGAREQLRLRAGSYAIVTLHRPANVDDEVKLSALADVLVECAAKIPLVFPVHPRTRQRLAQFNLDGRLQSAPGLRIIDPLGYIQFMNLVHDAQLVITDSGGIQEETTYLGIPCLTLRESTERPITVTLGSNRLVAPDELCRNIDAIATGAWRRGTVPPLWDGDTASRVAASLRSHLGA